jgi:O-antigen ligase
VDPVFLRVFRVFRGYFLAVSDSSSHHRTDPWTAVCTWLIFLIPLFSFPLIWTHPSWFKRFPYQFEFPWAGVVLVVVLGALAAAIWNPQGPISVVRFGSRPLLLMMGLVAGAWVLAVAVSDHPMYSASLVPFYLGLLAIFWIGSRVSSSCLLQVCHTWFFTVVVVVLFGLSRLITVPDFAATFGNRNFLAAFLVTGLLLGMAMIRHQLSWGHRLQAGGTVLGCVLILVGLRLCGSRGAWLGLLVVGSVWFIWLAPVWRSRWRIKLMVVLIGGALGFLVLRPYIAKVWATDVRPPIWEGTIKMILAKPVLGHGLGRYDMCLYPFLPPEQYERPCGTPTIAHAHNQVLELTAEQGVIGLGVMMALWVFCFWRAISVGCRATAPVAISMSLEPEAKRSAWPISGFSDEEIIYRLAIAGGVLAFLVHNLVDVNSQLAPMQAFGWLMLGLLASAGEQAGAGQRVEWCVAGAKRRIFSGLVCVVALAAGWLAVVQPLRAEYQEQKARIAAYYGEFETAAIHAATSLEANPYQLEVRYLYAGIFANWSDLMEKKNPIVSGNLRQLAITECNELRKYAPDYDTVAIRLAFLLAKDGQFEKAKDLAEWVLARRPNEKDAIRLLGLLEKEQNGYHEQPDVENPPPIL